MSFPEISGQRNKRNKRNTFLSKDILSGSLREGAGDGHDGYVQPVGDDAGRNAADEGAQ